MSPVEVTATGVPPAGDLVVPDAPRREPWTPCLIRIQCDDGKIAVDFEYENPSRWAITPANVRQMAETLRPRPGH